MNVRRFAAIDMYGARGTRRRRRIILTEFVVGVIAMEAFGLWLITSPSVAGRVLALWVIGAGLNYAPLAAYAIVLCRPGALDAELAGVDTGRQLRRYSKLQLWIFVPLSLVAFAIRDTLGRLRAGRSDRRQHRPAAKH